MRNPFLPVFLVVLCSLHSCREQPAAVNLPEPVKQAYGKDSLELDSVAYYDKVLGALAGSAIGDAMGASTEMWQRQDIRQKYGYITGLTPAVRVQSPEGTWEHNLNAGATTDDTRWKYLMVKYFTAHQTPGPELFARFITDYYKSVAVSLGDRDVRDNPDLLDSRLEKVDWIKEWARVAGAYLKGPEDYQLAQHRFYGGEMSCAGMLYSPMFGLIAENPEQAYKVAYGHSIFDIGYARDITGLVAAMTQTALQTESMDSILNTAVFTDPYRYQDSRLVGRISLSMAETARKYVWMSAELKPADMNLSASVPLGYPGTAEDWNRQEFVYKLLEADKKAIPFHAGEIWEILVAGLEYGQGDLEKTLQFIINYGRDNDTVGAVAGMILGARLGYSGLPVSLRETIVRVNKEQLGIDLEALAHELVNTPHNLSP